MSWQNWSGSVECSPSLRYPNSESDLITIVKDAVQSNLSIRTVGAGHSFTPLVKTEDILVSLDQYQGLVSVDKEKLQATVRAGTRIKLLGDLLLNEGLAFENLGDIDVQSIAGAISTGTHGTGIAFGNLATQVVGLRIITATGEVMTCSESENPELFKAAQISLGALGIISEITLQCVPAYTLHYVWKSGNLSETLERIEEYKQQNRNFEFYWIPHTNRVLLKFLNETDQAVRNKNLVRRFNDVVLENGVFWLFCQLCRYFPSQSKRIARIMARLISGGEDVNASHRVFASVRLVKFQEMEYNIPAEHFVTVMREIDACIRDNNIQVHFPLECRFVKGDDIPLSPAYGRDSAYVAVHMYRGMEYRDYFKAVEEIFKKFDGRPHWGKLHTRTAEDLSELYPQWEQFQQVRAQLDPNGLFLNTHLKSVFGAG